MSFQSDVATCVDEISAQVEPFFRSANLVKIRDYVDCLGIIMLPDPSISRHRGGLWDGTQILLSLFLNLQRLREVVSHEVVHALAETELWAPLNSKIAGWQYDRDEFLEAVATGVGRRCAVPKDVQLDETAQIMLKAFVSARARLADQG